MSTDWVPGDILPGLVRSIHSRRMMQLINDHDDAERVQCVCNVDPAYARLVGAHNWKPDVSVDLDHYVKTGKVLMKRG